MGQAYDIAVSPGSSVNRPLREVNGHVLIYRDFHIATAIALEY